MTPKLHSLLLSLLLSLAPYAVSLAQDGDPRHPEWVQLPYTIWHNDSLRRGEITYASFTGAGRVGDIDHSGTDDFVVGVRLVRKDSISATMEFRELWLYKGVQNSLPDLRDYHRIGPMELQSNVRHLASGDWDDDGDIDLCVNIQIHGDTTVGPTNGYEIQRTIIFWNDGLGNYSLADTTRLPNPSGLGGDVAYGRYGRVGDFSGDGVDDLLLNAEGAFVGGKVIPTARIFVYHGVRGGQWGRNGVSAKPVWGWWNVPEHDRMNILDQNCDSKPDLVFYHDRGSSFYSDLTIYYGNSTTDQTGTPDTLDIEVFTFDTVAGRGAFSLLSDISSDGVPDLILTCEDEYFRVYAGLPGKRLSEVYGTGNDPADPGNGFPDARPWAKVEMPGRVGPEFNSPTEGPLFDLGDADMDGWNDVWTRWGDIVVYRAGLTFDKLIDAYAYYGGELISLTLLGDIDGTGNPTRALTNGYVAGENVIQFLKSGTNLPTTGYPWTPPSGHLPDKPTGNRCSGIGEASREQRAVSSLGLHVVPNPASGQVRIRWEAEKRGNRETEITVHDLSGNAIYQQVRQSGSSDILWDAEEVSSGVYYITVTIGNTTETIKTIIE